MKFYTDDRAILVKHGLVPGLFNGMLNGLLAIYAHPSDAIIGLWLHGAYGIDLALTGFLLPTITWLILYASVQKPEGTSSIQSFCSRHEQWLADRLGSSRIGSSIVWGALGMLIFGIPVIAMLQVLDAPDLNEISYATLKGAYAGTISVLLQPLMARTRIRFLKRHQGVVQA